MTVVGLDDTDSRERGMCTTYVAARIAERLRREGSVDRLLLGRLDPAVEHKTRGNAALAIHTDCDPRTAYDVARTALESLSETADPATNPGLVVADHGPDAAPESVRAFARAALRERLEIAEAEALLEDRGYRSWGAGNGRGRIGALAAVGAWAGWDDALEADGGDSSANADGGATSAPDGPDGDWTYEYISYREPNRWGTPREVDRESVFAAAASGYPTVWDTVDREEGETVCVPHTPGPILHGVRGDDPDAVRAVAREIEGEPVDFGQLFVTNQGTDAHLRPAGLEAVRDGRAYRVEGTVVTEPETRRGGHVFVTLANGDGETTVDAVEPDALEDEASEADALGADTSAAAVLEHAGGDDEPTRTLECAAFEPTKRFRDRVRALRVGDRIVACGEVSRGTLKLEKFAVRDLVTAARTTPTCPACERTMESAGRGQGYRCRDCGTSADGKATVEIDRDLEEGWYEVPPCARRHVAKPLVRGGFDGPIHPER